MYYSPAAPLLTLSSSGMPWASYFLQPLASVTKIHAQMSISVGTWSLLPERKTAEWEEKYAPVRSCKHTHKGADMHRLTDYRHRERCLQTYAYVYASHTHAWTNWRAYKHRCDPMAVNILAHLEEYICTKISKTVVSSWRYLSKVERRTVLFSKYVKQHKCK